MTPGSKSTIFGTYCFLQMSSFVSPDLVDAPHILEFLRSLYDQNTGLFKNSIDEEPSIEATFYAYEFLSKLGDLDLTWLNTFNLRTYIKDHLTETSFQFDGVDIYSAQLFAGSISKFISFTVPFKDLRLHEGEASA